MVLLDRNGIQSELAKEIIAGGVAKRSLFTWIMFIRS